MSDNAVITNEKAKLGLVEFVALMAFMTSLVALAIDAMLPALNQIGADLNSKSPQQTHLIISIFFVGMAFGQLFFGPYSDAKGRRSAILTGLIIFAIGTVICMFAENMTVMLLGRVVQAFGVSGPRIATIALIRDLYSGEAMARVMSFIMMVFILVPMIAPAFGQAILALLSWHHIFSSFLVIGSGIGIWFFSRQSETLPKYKRKLFSWSSLFSSSKFILTHKEVMLYATSMGFIFGAFLAYLSASQTIFEDFYLVGSKFALYFAVLAFSIGLASFVNGAMVMRLGMRKLCFFALCGNVLVSAVLVVVALKYQGLPPLWMLVTLFFINFFFVGILFGNLNSMAMVPLGDMAGLGAAIIGFLGSVISVVIAISIGSFITDSITPVVIGFLVFAVLSFVCVYCAGPREDKPLSSSRTINDTNHP